MSGRSPITTHVLDTARGRPAAGLGVTLGRWSGETWTPLGDGRTDADGRALTLLAPGAVLEPGTYRLTFAVGAWQDGFFPEVAISFRVVDPAQHYHVPLLLSPFGYSTYRGS